MTTEHRFASTLTAQLTNSARRALVLAVEDTAKGSAATALLNALVRVDAAAADAGIADAGTTTLLVSHLAVRCTDAGAIIRAIDRATNRALEANVRIDIAQLAYALTRLLLASVPTDETVVLDRGLLDAALGTPTADPIASVDGEMPTSDPLRAALEDRMRLVEIETVEPTD